MVEFPLWLQLTIGGFACARATVMVIADRVFDLPRGYLLAKLQNHPMLTYLVTCALCAGFWITVLWFVPWLLWPDLTTLIATPFAVAMAAWWLGDWRGDHDA